MGLSTKQVPAGDQALDWSQTLLESAGTVESKPTPIRRQQQQQQQSEPLDCPRCGSTNTKFCYYNNYNKSQPRHFCKACKRHWTKGGTLRNVPVGGGRKNKRLKVSSASTSSSATTGITIPTNSISHRKNVHVQPQNYQQDSHNFSLPALGDQNNISDILYQALINSSSSVQHDPINGFTTKNFMGNKGTSSPMISLPQDQNLQFSCPSLSPFENIPSPIPSFHQSLNGYDYSGKLDSVKSSTITTVTPATISIFSQPWQGTTTSSVMAEMPTNYWNWNDIDTLVSADLNIPWDDTEIKP